MSGLQGAGSSALPALIALALHPEPRVRGRVAQVLGNLGGSDAAPVLGGLLRDTDQDVSLRAAAALARLEVHAVPPAVSALHDPRPEVRTRAATLLGRVSLPAGTDALIAALADDSPSVRREAAESLGRHAAPHSVDALMRAFWDCEPLVRDRAATGLVRLGGAAVGALERAFRHHGTGDRIRIIGVARQVGSQALPLLIQALEADAADVRRAAAYALGQLGSRSALPVLKGRLPRFGWIGGERDTRVLQAVRSAIEQITSRTDAVANLPVPGTPDCPDLRALPLPGNDPDAQGDPLEKDWRGAMP